MERKRFTPYDVIIEINALIDKTLYRRLFPNPEVITSIYRYETWSLLSNPERDHPDTIVYRITDQNEELVILILHQDKTDPNNLAILVPRPHSDGKVHVVEAATGRLLRSYSLQTTIAQIKPNLFIDPVDLADIIIRRQVVNQRINPQDVPID